MAGELVTVKVEAWYSAQWNDITADVRHDPVPSITRGIASEGGRADPGSMRLTVNNGRSKVNTDVVGRYSPRNPDSDLFGLIGRNTPVRVSAGLDPEDLSVRGVMEAVSWPVRWDRSEADVWVPLECAGILRRLGIPSQAAPNSVQRFAAGAVAYWPLDDPEGSSQGRGQFGGGPLTSASRKLAPQYARGFLAGHLPVGVLSGTEDGGVMRATITGAAGGGFSMDMAVRATDPAGWQGNLPQIVAFVVETAAGDGAGQRWGIVIDSTATVSATITDVATGSTLDSDTGAVPILNGEFHHLRMTVAPAGGTDATLTVAADGVVVATATADIGAAAPTAASRLFTEWVIFAGADQPVAFSQMVLWGTTAPTLAEAADAYRGHRGETAGRRVERLCSEASVAFTSRGDLDATTPMGAQRPAAFLALLDECAAAEAAGGLLPIVSEQRDALGLRFVTRASHYVVDSPAFVELALDYAGSHLWEPFEPTDDDQQTANDVTAQRPGGGQAQQVQQSGPLGIDTIGRYDRTLRLAVTSDLQLPNLAGWALHLGTWDEARYPTIALNLRGLSTRAGGGDLVDDAVALDLGDLITIANLPEWMPPGDVEQFTLGVAEVVNAERWELHWHSAPAGPYRVSVYADDEETPAPDAPARRDTAGSRTVAEFVAGTDTAMSVETTLGPRWTLRSAAVPFDIGAAGSQLRVTAVEGAEVRDGEVLILTGPATGLESTDPPDYGQVEVTGTLAVDQTATGGSLVGAVVLREVGGSGAYYLRVHFTTGGNVFLSVTVDNLVSPTVGQIGDNQDSFFDYTPDQVFNFRARVEANHMVRGKVWPSGTDEPGWQIARQVTTGINAAGEVGFGVAKFSGNSNTDPEFTFGDMSVVEPQTLTITQTPINGVNKTLPAGTSVALWTPARYTL